MKPKIKIMTLKESQTKDKILKEALSLYNQYKLGIVHSQKEF